MKTEIFKAWLKDHPDELEKRPAQDCIARLHRVEEGLLHKLDDYPLENLEIVLDMVQPSRFPEKSGEVLRDYKSAIKKYWKFRTWMLTHSKK